MVRQQHYKFLLDAFLRGDINLFYSYSDEIEEAGGSTLAEIVRQVAKDPEAAYTRIRSTLDHSEMVCEFHHNSWHPCNGSVLFREALRCVRYGSDQDKLALMGNSENGYFVGYRFIDNLWREVNWVRDPWRRMQSVNLVDWSQVSLVAWETRVLYHIWKVLIESRFVLISE